MHISDKKATKSGLAFRHDLQGLRAIAVTLVILAHARIEGFYGGFVGVDVFFVLSGFLISGILFSELGQQGKIAFIRFYARRLKRLLPALFVMVFLSFFAGVAILSEAEARAQLVSAPFAMTWISNLYFAFSDVGYFDELASRDLFLHTWSLGVEEQFYLIWPLLLFALHKVSPSSKPANLLTRNIAPAGLIFVFVLSFLVSLYWMKNEASLAFYLMPSRIWQFSLGALCWLAIHGRSKDSIKSDALSRPFVCCLLLCAGVAFILGSAGIIGPSNPYPGLWAIVPSLGAACVILSGEGVTQDKKGALGHPILVWVGDRAYSLYLWHWPIFTLGFTYGIEAGFVPVLAMTLLTALIASMSYRWIEVPFWKGRWSAGGSKRIVLSSLLLIAVSVLVMFHVWRQYPEPASQEDISYRWRGDVPVIYQHSCDAWYAHAIVEPCIYNSDKYEKTVVLFGDSILAQWFTFVPSLFRAPRWRTIVLTKSSCAIVDENYYYGKVGGEYAVCRQWRDDVLVLLEKLHPDVIFMGSASTYKFTSEQWREGTSRILERLHQITNKIFIIPGTPSLSFDGPGCVARNISNLKKLTTTDICSSLNRGTLVDPVVTELREAAGRFDNTELLDLNDLVCPGGTCSAVNNQNVVVFRDSQHLTDTFVRSLVPIIREKLGSLDFVAPASTR